MESSSALPKIIAAYPNIIFTPGETFSWNHAQRTISYAPNQPVAFLLHEIAHAQLGHARYLRDIELIVMEREAWEYAQIHLAPQFSIDITDETIDVSLDTYRDWLHARSTCPTCEATGFQSARGHYTCPACTHVWRVNEARTCQLRRTKK